MFLTNHMNVLLFLTGTPDATLREVSEHLGITERSVHRIVQELIDVKVVRRYKDGRRNRYEIKKDFPLSTPLAPHLSVGRLIQAAGCSSEIAPASRDSTSSQRA